MRIGIYARVSTEEQKNKGISLRDQEQRGIEFCGKNGFNYEIFSDGGYSGELDIEERPELNRLVEKILANPKEIDGVFVVDLDRLTRDAEVGFFLKHLLIENDVKLFNIEGYEINLKDENEELMMGIKFLLSSFELKKLRARIKRALERNAKDGKVSGGPIKPYGYEKGENNKLIINQEESLIIKRIYNLSIDGLSTRKIAELLNLEGIKTKRSKSEKGYLTLNGVKKNDFFWRDATIHRILKNTLYKGKRKYKGKFYECPMIIDEDKFELVQRILETRKNFKDTTNKYFYMLKGLITCPVCGLNFYGRKREDLSDNQYICCSQRLSNFCGNRGINIDKLNKIIWDLVIQLPQNMKKIIIKSEGAYERNLKEKQNKYQDKLKTKQNEVQKILTLFIENDAGREVVKSKLTELENEIKTFERELKLIERELKMIDEHEDFLNDLSIQLKKYAKKEPDDLTKQKIIRTYIKRIFLKWSSTINNHLIVVQFEIDRFTDLNLQGLAEVKYKTSGWRYDNEYIKYGFRAVMPDFDIKVLDGGKTTQTITGEKVGFGIRVEDDIFNITRSKSVNSLINKIREAYDPYNDNKYRKNSDL
jgi:site-specific DNA recombinase